LLVAGHETTTNLPGNAIFCFTEYPGVIEDLQANPELLPDAIEEVLRYRTSIAGILRMTRTDTQIGTIAIKAGERVLLQLASANHDEAAFADPDRFDIRRTPNRHISFGHSIHFCLGAPLARMESRIALHAMLERPLTCNGVLMYPLHYHWVHLVYSRTRSTFPLPSLHKLHYI